jgi:hypothetical protein
VPAKAEQPPGGFQHGFMTQRRHGPIRQLEVFRVQAAPRHIGDNLRVKLLQFKKHLLGHPTSFSYSDSSSNSCDSFAYPVVALLSVESVLTNPLSASVVSG